MTQSTTEIGATAIERSFTISGPSSASNTPTSATFTDNFQKEKHRLSGKPLFRPVRRLSAASPSSAEVDSEEAARQLLQRRMPPRSRIQAILDRRAGGNEDPWLNDEYDWRP
jgi:hypothetical protein